jgi:hypothetical protein
VANLAVVLVGRFAGELFVPPAIDPGSNESIPQCSARSYRVGISRLDGRIRRSGSTLARRSWTVSRIAISRSLGSMNSKIERSTNSSRDVNPSNSTTASFPQMMSPSASERLIGAGDASSNSLYRWSLSFDPGNSMIPKTVL